MSWLETLRTGLNGIRSHRLRSGLTVLGILIGIAAVILELAEPAVRTGVWKHSTFRQDPLGRLQRTGLAAMVTVYGARSIAERMIQGVVRMHAGVTGETPAGEPGLLTQAAPAFAAGDSPLVASES